jgi:hypothetical protein
MTRVRQANRAGKQDIRERLGPALVGQQPDGFPEDLMHEDHLTVDQCDEMANALREDAARLPSGSDKQHLLQLAERYCTLAELKRMVLRLVN